MNDPIINIAADVLVVTATVSIVFIAVACIVGYVRSEWL